MTGRMHPAHSSRRVQAPGALRMHFVRYNGCRNGIDGRSRSRTFFTRSALQSACLFIKLVLAPREAESGRCLVYEEARLKARAERKALTGIGLAPEASHVGEKLLLFAGRLQSLLSRIDEHHLGSVGTV